MISNYSNLLNTLENDISQLSELYKTEHDGGGIVQIDDQTQRINTILKKSLKENEHPVAAEPEKILKWTWNHVIKSRTDAFNLYRAANDSGDPKKLEEALNAIDRLEKQFYTTRRVFETMDQGVPQGDLKQKIHAVFRTLTDQSTSLSEAKLNLARKIQRVANPPQKIPIFKQLFGASPFVSSAAAKQPPTPERPYWVSSRDATQTGKDWAKEMFLGAEEEFKANAPYPKQFVADANRQAYTLQGKFTNPAEDRQTSDDDYTKKIFDRLLEIAKGDRRVAFRLSFLTTQKLALEMTQLAMEHASPRGGKMYHDVRIEQVDGKPYVIWACKALYRVTDPENVEIEKGAVLIKKEFSIPLSEFSKEVLDPANPFPSLRAKDIWSSSLRTRELAETEIQNF